MNVAPRLRSLIRWADPWLVLALAIGGWLRFGRISDFDNQYYTATVASMLQSYRNFLFASFDPGGMVMVDKPPGAFWIQATLPAVFNVSRWTVNLPQAVAGILSVLLLYLVVKRTFGRVAGVAAALVLAVLPASIVIDSRNEPDGLLSFALLLAAICISAARSGRWLWLMAFALLMGFAFNIKMLVAFVPLPAFLAYYLLATRQPARRLALRFAFAVAVLLIVSFLWVSLVALTPAQERPYIGSTRDNSIGTLVFKYNGIERFTSFIGPRPRQPQPGPSLSPGAQQPPGVPGYPSPQAAPATGPGASDQGVLGLLSNPLAPQLGWLLPLAVLALLAALMPLLSERVFRRPSLFLSEARDSPAISETLLWTGWLATAALAFGLANSTTTHPYYLVGMAVPLAAVAGVGFAILWRAFREEAPVSWVALVALGGALAYQVYGSRGLVGDWVVAAVIAVMLLALAVLSAALWKKLCATPLAAASLAAGGLALLAIPLVAGLSFGGQIAGRGPPPFLPQGNPEQQRLRAVSSYIEQEGDAGAVFTLGAVSAREAAPFIIAGVPALAIGGFSGGDPVFTVESFRALVERGDLRYFLMPGAAGPGGPAGLRQQEPILSYIRSAWQDVSRPAGLPPGSLYRYVER